MALIEADELIRRIKADFPLEPLPQVYGQGYDSHSADLLLTGVPWAQLSVPYVEEVNDKHQCDAGVLLCKVTDETFRYYVPAYMIMFFGNDYNKSAWLFDHLLSLLNAYLRATPDWEQKDKTLDQRRLQCFSGFTENQKRDIADFLYHQTYFEGRNLYLNGTYNQWAESAFDSYWHQFASQEAA